ncbi:LCP family protein [Smaragdicoccus niigatensis]
MVLSLVILGTSGYGWASLNHLTSGVSFIDIGTGDNTPDVDGEDQNILLLGDDHRPEGMTQQEIDELHAGTHADTADLNTDTMMLLHVPANGARATVISFPRDSWVTIPGGYGKRKLNAAFSLGNEAGGEAGGIRLLVRTIQGMTGLKIDHFVRVSLLGFYTIAQELGPIKVCLNEATYDEFSGADFAAGEQYLNASQALAFVRQRHGLPRGDLDRQVRQQYFMSAALRKVISSGMLLKPARLQRLLDAVSNALQTDPTLDLLKFSRQMQNISAGNVTFATIPITGTPTIEGDGGEEISIVAVDWNAMPAFISTVVGETKEYSEATILPRKDVSVQVLNGTGEYGQADTATENLKSLGFTTLEPDALEDTTTLTTITYGPGMEAQAKTLAKAVPGAIVGFKKSATTVTLALGTDGIQVPSQGDETTTETTTTKTKTSTSESGSSKGESDTLDRTYTSEDCIN